mmetsp:Transcript_9796/g.21206  ORF Transcript_9796/g.21206 Transcript_9796/m.21206 type:complete len:223 (+) Transcript_9796:352-1020(+)
MSEIVFLRLRRPLPPRRFAWSTCFCCSSSVFFRKHLMDRSDSACPCLITSPAAVHLFLASASASVPSSSLARSVSFARRICSSSNLLQASVTACRNSRCARYRARLTTRGVFDLSSITLSMSETSCVCSGMAMARRVSRLNILSFPLDSDPSDEDRASLSSPSDPDRHLTNASFSSNDTDRSLANEERSAMGLGMDRSGGVKWEISCGSNLAVALATVVGVT